MTADAQYQVMIVTTVSIAKGITARSVQLIARYVIPQSVWAVLMNAHPATYLFAGNALLYARNVKKHSVKTV